MIKPLATSPNINSQPSFKATRLFPVNLCEKATKRLVPGFFTELCESDIPQLAPFLEKCIKQDKTSYFEIFRNRFTGYLRTGCNKNKFYAVEEADNNIVSLVNTIDQARTRDLYLLLTNPNYYEKMGGGKLGMYGALRSAPDNTLNLVIHSQNNPFYVHLQEQLPHENIMVYSNFNVFTIWRRKFNDFLSHIEQTHKFGRD